MRMCLVTAGAVAALARGAAAGDGKLILDESAYWPYYIWLGLDRLDAAALRSEAETALGRGGMRLLLNGSEIARGGLPAEGGADWQAVAMFERILPVAAAEVGRGRGTGRK